MKLNPVEACIMHYNGVRNFAKAVDRNPSTVCRWREAGYLPGDVINSLNNNKGIKQKHLLRGITVKKSKITNPWQRRYLGI